MALEGTRGLLISVRNDLGGDWNDVVYFSKPKDGSVDLYFGAKAPEGKEANWIQTVPGKGWFACLRLYRAAGPLVR